MVESNFDDDYKLGKLLGYGAYAEVKVAVSKKDDTEFAVKIADKSKFVEDDEECLQIEIENLSKLKHPNIIRLFDVYNTADYYYLVLEFVRGGELFDRIISKERYSENEAGSACESILTAIGYCHKNCIIHRDLKPENLLLLSEDNDTEIKIADFGFSKRVTSPEARCLTTRCGTPDYVAPEVLAGKMYNTKADTWSLGVIFYILLCGYPPFYDEQERVQNLFRQIMKGKYDFEGEAWNQVSDEAKDLISKLLVVNPAKRLSCELALKHPWFSLKAESDLFVSKENLGNYYKNKKFRAAAQVVILANRLTKLFSSANAGEKVAATTIAAKSHRNKRGSIPANALEGLKNIDFGELDD